MKKILITVLTAALLLSSCAKNNDNNDSANQNNNQESTNTETVTDKNTLGDDNGDGMIEDETDGGSTENNNDNGSNFTTVDKVESAEDAKNFIGGNVYSLCKDVLPMYTETMILSTEDMDSITYNTGLTDVSGINDILISESMVGSIAYSLVMLRTDGSNTEEIQTALGNSINPAKWICVSADKVASIVLDNDIILVMGSSDQVDAIMDAVTKAAADVYQNVGSVTSVLG